MYADPVDSAKEWKKLPLYLGGFDKLRDEHIVDVIKFGIKPRHRTKQVITSSSSAAKGARDALAEDPYNIHLIYDLAYQYAAEGHFEQCMNVMLRGWKRASEIEDSSARFRFLMKLCELSYSSSKFRQAQAVLQDIDEPEDPSDRKAYFILSCHVHSANKDVQRTLRAFQRAIEGEGYQSAVRVFALTLLNLRDVGLYEIGKSAIDKLAPVHEKESILFMLDKLAYTNAEYTGTANNTHAMYGVIAAAVALLSFVVYLLYRLEQWSLQRLNK